MFSAWRRRLAGLRPDLTPWRTSRDFRILFAAGAVYFFGNWIGFVAMPYQIYELTGSNFAVGAMGLVEVVPMIVFGLYGGALADHVDRRTMLVVTGFAQVLVVFLLLGNALLAEPKVWLLYICGGLLAVAGSLQRPSREALLPRVVRHDEMAAATALTSLSRQTGQLAGPAIGGVLVASAGVAWAYAADLAMLVVAGLLPLLMAAYPARGQTEPPSLRHGGSDQRPVRDRQRWRYVCCRCGRDGGLAARLLAVRRADRRARHPRTPGPRRRLTLVTHRYRRGNEGDRGGAGGCRATGCLQQ